MKKILSLVASLLLLSPFVASAQMNLVQGGTGLSTYTAGDLIYASANTLRFSKLNIGAVGTCLTSSGTLPQWTACASGNTDKFATSTNLTTIYPNAAKALVLGSTATTTNINEQLGILGGGNAGATSTGLYIAPITAGTRNWNLWSGSPSSSFDSYLLSQGYFDTPNVFTSLNSARDYVGAASFVNQSNQNLNTYGAFFINLVTAANAPTAAGGYSDSAFKGTGTLSLNVAHEVHTDNLSTGTITDNIGLRVSSPTNSGGGTLTNNYGLRIFDQTSGTSNFAIKTGLGLNDLGDSLLVRASTTLQNFTGVNSTTTNATTTNLYVSGNASTSALYVGTGAGCAQVSSAGKLTSTGSACGSGSGGGGNSKWATSTTPNAIYPNAADKVFVGLTSGGTAKVEIQGSSTAATEQALLVWNSNNTAGPILSALNNQKVGIATSTPQANLSVATSTADANWPFLNIGPSGLSSGSSGGTFLGGNSQAGFVGNFFDFQKAGTSEFKIDNAGAGTFASNATVGASSGLIFNGRAQLQSSADGILNLFNNAATGFTRLNFGGTTTAFPGLARVGQNLVITLGDGTNGGQLAIGTSTPTNYSLAELASTTPYIDLEDTDGATNTKHGIIGFNSGQFTFGTTSDSTYNSTSSAMTVQPGVSSGLGIATGTPGTLLSGILNVGPGTATRPQLILDPTPTQTAPTLSGTIWNDQTQLALSAFQAGISQNLPGALYTVKAQNVVQNSTTETSILGTSATSGIGTTTIPANFWVAGKTVKIDIGGVYGTKTITPGNLTIKVKWGTTVLASETLNALASAAAKAGWNGEVMVTCLSVAANNCTFSTAGHILYAAANPAATNLQPIYGDINNSGDTVSAAVNASNRLDVTATWATADVANIATTTSAIMTVSN